MEDKDNYIFGFLKLIFLGGIILTSLIFIGKYLTEKRPLIAAKPLVKEVIEEQSPPPRVKKRKIKKRKKVKKPKIDKIVADNQKIEIVEKKEDVKIEIHKKKKKVLRIESLKIIQLPEDNVIRLTFKLRNRSRDKRIKGRIFVKFIRDGSSFTYPKTEFADNIPVDIHKGIYYSIKKYRRVEIIIQKGIDLKKFRKVQFLIYEDTDGVTLVYDKVTKLRVESGDIFKNPF